MLSTYDRIMPFDKGQIYSLYGMMVFPEKFWKISNRYQNTRKSWMSAQNMDKLEKFVREKEQRSRFLESIQVFCGKI